MEKSKIGNYLLIIALCVTCFFIGKSKVEHKIERVEIEKIKKEIDTLYLERKVIEKQIVYKEKHRDKLKDEEKLINYDTICNEIVYNLKEQLANCDSIVGLKDKIIYKTDSVVIYKDKIINVKPKPKPFGVGAQVGYGIDGKPYIGVGVSVNLLRF